MGLLLLYTDIYRNSCTSAKEVQLRKPGAVGVQEAFPGKFTASTCYFLYLGSKMVLSKTVRAEKLYAKI